MHAYASPQPDRVSRAKAQRVGRSREPGDGNVRFGGWIWRYDLAALGPSVTEVRLSYDWSAVPEEARQPGQFPPFSPDHLASSLDHLGELVSS